MTTEEYTGYIERLQQMQMECINDASIIFALSLSHSQVRVVIFSTLSPTQSFFLYKDAPKYEGDKLMQRITSFMRNVSSGIEHGQS